MEQPRFGQGRLALRPRNESMEWRLALVGRRSKCVDFGSFPAPEPPAAALCAAHPSLCFKAAALENRRGDAQGVYGRPAKGCTAVEVVNGTPSGIGQNVSLNQNR